MQDNKDLAALKALAEAAEKCGQHIYDNPRDSNKWKENEAWQKAASPEAFLSLLSRIEQQAARIAELEAENDKVRESLGYSAMATTMLHGLSVKDGGINAKFSGGAAHLLAEALGEQFMESGATNYLEVGFNSKAGRLLVTLQRVDGKTPAQLQHEAEAKLAAIASTPSPAVDLSGLTRAYNSGYKAGHHDTVEAQYTDIDQRDMLTYHADVVAELVADGTIPASPARDVGGLTEKQREAVREAIAGALGEAYDCTRVWSAWSYGTMGPDDFVLVAEDDDRLNEITEAVCEVLATKEAEPDLTAVRLAVLEEAAQACEHVMDECRDKNSGKWPEMQEPSDMGAGYCVDAVQALKQKPAPAAIRALATSPAPSCINQEPKSKDFEQHARTLGYDIPANWRADKDCDAFNMWVGWQMLGRLLAAPSASQGEVKAAATFELIGNVCEIGQLESEHGEHGLILKRAEDSFVTIKGLPMDDVRALSQFFMDDIVISFRAAAPSVTDGEGKK